MKLRSFDLETLRGFKKLLQVTKPDNKEESKVWVSQADERPQVAH